MEKISACMDSAEKRSLVEWQNKILFDFVDRCPCGVFLYLYPEAGYFRDRMTAEGYRSFLERCLKIETDANGLKRIEDNFWSAFFEEALDRSLFIECFGRLRFDVKNGIIRAEDVESKYINCENGHRRTIGNHDAAKRNVFLFGACSVFGILCEDEKTIGSYLQAYINDVRDDINVINCGIWGSENIFSSLFAETISQNDIVVIILTNYHGSRKDIHPQAQVRDIKRAFDALKDMDHCLLNNYAHFNWKANAEIAKTIYADIKSSLSAEGGQTENRGIMKPQNYFVSWDIYQYFNQYIQQYHLCAANTETGCIVMNCNPVTIGHQYLVEYARRQTELLYIFIVEEDVSQFSFADRFRYAEKAFGQYDNVRVLPSGKFMISMFTFPDYFEKNQITEEFDTEYDIRIFAEALAPHLNIKKRFVGTEPFSSVTKAYNDSMKLILAEYQIELIEVPRYTLENTPVSASYVRKLISEKRYDEIARYIPAQAAGDLLDSVLAAAQEEQR